MPQDEHVDPTALQLRTRPGENGGRALAKQPVFPNPTYFGRSRFWLLSELVEYECSLAGKSPPEKPDPASDRYLSAAQVRHRYASVSDMWIWRRLKEARDASQPVAA
jgi:hypothetical protein